jgi:hypothetical protein
MSFVRPPPKDKSVKGYAGAESEAIISTALIQAGYTVLIPNGYMHRYDLVIEDADGRFWRIQCKTAWLARDQKTLRFQGCSLLYKGQKGRKETTRQHYQGAVDFFAVYSPDTKQVYLLPILDVSDTENYLRLAPTRNNQEKGIKYAADYVL